MAWDNSATYAVGTISLAANIHQIFTNLKYLKGTDAGQSAIDVPAEYAPGSSGLEGTGTSVSFETAGAADFSGVRLLIERQGSDLPGNDDMVSLLGTVANNSGAEELGRVRFARIEPTSGDASSGEFRLFTYAAGVLPSQSAVHVDENGKVGFGTDASSSYALKVGGKVNATGYTAAGAAINDWTLTDPGPPAQLDWTGNAKATVLESRLATGTAPFVVASTTVCPLLNAEQMDSHSWHRGHVANGSADAGDMAASTDTDLSGGSITLDKAGVWFVVASGIWYRYGSSRSELLLKIKDGGGTQIGSTAEMEPTHAYQGATAFTAGFYTSALGTETVKLVANRGTARANILIEAKLIAIWRSP